MTENTVIVPGQIVALKYSVVFSSYYDWSWTHRTEL